MKTTKKSTNKHAIVSIALFIIFLLLPVSGIMLAKTKDSPDAFANQFWDTLHGVLGVLFVVFGCFHIVHNWKALKHYIMPKNKNL
jgi:amino acid transporter